MSAGEMYLSRVPQNCEGMGASLPWGPLSPGQPGPEGWTQIERRTWILLILCPPSLLTDGQDSLLELPFLSLPEKKKSLVPKLEIILA